MILILAVVACSDDRFSVHTPNLFEQCGRMPIAEYTAEANECIRLEDINEKTLFRLATSESCGGPPCMTLHPGEKGYVLEKVKPGDPAEWDVQRGPCDQMAQCCGEYEPCGGYCCW
jgi:hypothetical protein